MHPTSPSLSHIPHLIIMRYTPDQSLKASIMLYPYPELSLLVVSSVSTFTTSSCVPSTMDIDSSSTWTSSIDSSTWLSVMDCSKVPSVMDSSMVPPVSFTSIVTSITELSAVCSAFTLDVSSESHRENNALNSFNSEPTK